jgi:hypothetical protein
MSKKLWTTWYENNSGGKLARRVGGRRFHVIEWTNMDDACGRDNEGHPKYVVELSEVDLDSAPIEEAKRSCGWEGAPDTDEALAEMVHGYGAKAPLYSGEGNGLAKLVAEAKRESRALASDPDAYEERMSRPVNALGSTAREFQASDFQSAMVRGVFAGDPKARVMAKMHGADQTVIDDVRPDDWMPYLMGYLDGLSGREGEKHADLAAEYGLGYQRGVRVAKGEAPVPGWIRVKEHLYFEK